MRCVIECFNWFRHSKETTENDEENFDVMQMKFITNSNAFSAEFVRSFFKFNQRSYATEDEIFSHNVFIRVHRIINNKLKEFLSTCMATLIKQKKVKEWNRKRQTETDKSYIPHFKIKKYELSFQFWLDDLIFLMKLRICNRVFVPFYCVLFSNCSNGFLIDSKWWINWWT